MKRSGSYLNRLCPTGAPLVLEPRRFKGGWQNSCPNHKRTATYEPISYLTHWHLPAANGSNPISSQLHFGSARWFAMREVCSSMLIFPKAPYYPC